MDKTDWIGSGDLPFLPFEIDGNPFRIEFRILKEVCSEDLHLPLVGMEVAYVELSPPKMPLCEVQLHYRLPEEVLGNKRCPSAQASFGSEEAQINDWIKLRQSGIRYYLSLGDQRIVDKISLSGQKQSLRLEG
ncbi:hypothetical protein M0R45_017600 [Rubus argutus]|uniref:Uncharacterized protein n=1 Tax=Rubus argutus TaxID=59490 RepID=A0AAW1XWS1_RUBAR